MKHIIYLLAITLLLGCSYDRKASNSQYNVEFLANSSCTKADFHQTHLVDDINDEYSKKILKDISDFKEQCEIFNSIYKSSEDIYNKLSIGTNIPEFVYISTIDIKSTNGIATLNIGYFHSEQECNEFIKKLNAANIKANNCFSRVLFQKRLWV